jgi:hypothetical protein
MIYVFDMTNLVSLKDFDKDIGHVHNQCQSCSLESQIAAVTYTLHLFCRLLDCSYIHNILFLKCPQMTTAVCSFLWNKQFILVQTKAVGLQYWCWLPQPPMDYPHIFHRKNKDLVFFEHTTTLAQRHCYCSLASCSQWQATVSILNALS